MFVVKKIDLALDSRAETRVQRMSRDRESPFLVSRTATTHVPLSTLSFPIHLFFMTCAAFETQGDSFGRKRQYPSAVLDYLGHPSLGTAHFSFNTLCLASSSKNLRFG